MFHHDSMCQKMSERNSSAENSPEAVAIGGRYDVWRARVDDRTEIDVGRAPVLWCGVVTSGAMADLCALGVGHQHLAPADRP